MSETKKILVGILMGSDSDWPVMKAAGEVLTEFGVGWEARVLSAHRTPGDVAEYAREAEGRGLRVIIAGAGGAAHLAGVVAAWTVVPVIGVPIESRSLRGLDSLLSIVQMPAGVRWGVWRSGRGGMRGCWRCRCWGWGMRGCGGGMGSLRRGWRRSRGRRMRSCRGRGGVGVLGADEVFLGRGGGGRGFGGCRGKCFLNETKRGGVSSYESRNRN